MNTEKIIADELNSIEKYIKEAKAQYNTQGTTPNSISPDYHVLFILIHKFTMNGTSYVTNSVDNQIFYEAIDNFKSSVETFTSQNVHIVPTIKTIDEVSITGRTYLIYEDIYSYLQKYSAAGLYDSVIVATKDCPTGGGMTTLGMFEFENIMFGFSHSVLAQSDTARVGKGRSCNYPYLLTTNIFIHEWLHQLEGYTNRIAAVFPVIDSPNNTSYEWNKIYFSNTTKYPYMIDDQREITGFYRAVLSAEVKYSNNSITRKIGVFPLFWKVTPRKIVIGRYLVRNSSGSYYYNSNGTVKQTTSLLNNMTFVWNIYYSFSNNKLKITCFNDKNATITVQLDNLKCTRVGPYDDGEYILVNLTLDEKLLSYDENYNLKMLAYGTNDRQTFNAESFSELYYSLRTHQNSAKYLDLNNNNNTEGNTVALGGWTGYASALTWQFRFEDGIYKIMPLASPTRSLSYYSSKLHITSQSNLQNWRPELVSNGKYVFPVSYKIKDVNSNKYLSYSGGTLKLTSSPTVWNMSESTDNYYYIYTSSDSTKNYMDVKNASNTEGNTIGTMPYLTGYTNAQTWKFMLQTDDSVIIVPRLSLTRGMKSTTTNTVLSSTPTYFRLEKV